MASRHDDAGADRLLSEVILKNLLLNQFHDVPPKEANYCQIHTRIHQPERIASGDNTVEHLQILESPTDNFNLRMRSELPAKEIAEFLPFIYESQSHT